MTPFACPICGRLTRGGPCGRHPTERVVDLRAQDVPVAWRDAALGIGRAGAMAWCLAAMLFLGADRFTGIVAAWWLAHPLPPSVMSTVSAALLFCVFLALAAQGVRRIQRIQAAPETPPTLRRTARDALRRVLLVHGALTLSGVAVELAIEWAVHAGHASSHLYAGLVWLLVPLAMVAYGASRFPGLDERTLPKPSSGDRIAER